MIVHGKNNENTEFRYVWARPKGNPEHKFHIAKRYSKSSQGHWSGKTVSTCSHGFHWFKNEEVDIYEWKSKQNYQFHHCYFCIGNKKDANEKIQQYSESLPPEVHGKMNGVAYRYVWARPGGKWQMRYHIARMFEGDFAGGGPNLQGTVHFLCSHYQGRWKRSEVNVKEWNNLPNYYNRCDFCSGQLEKYEGLVYQVEDCGKFKQHKFHEHTDKATLNQAKEKQTKQAMEGHMKEHTTKPDEEDIGVETENESKYYDCQECQSNTCKCDLIEKERVKKCLQNNVGMGRNNILPPYSECVKCKRRYAINVGTYEPLDGTGIRLSAYDDHATKEALRTANIYRCVCDYPVLIQITSPFGMNEKVFVGRPVLK